MLRAPGSADEDRHGARRASPAALAPGCKDILREVASRCKLLEGPSSAMEREIGRDAGGEPCSPPLAPDKRYKTTAGIVPWLMLSRVVRRVSDAARTGCERYRRCTGRRPPGPERRQIGRGPKKDASLSSLASALKAAEASRRVERRPQVGFPSPGRAHSVGPRPLVHCHPPCTQ